MADGRKVTISVDIVQGGTGSRQVKSELDRIAAEARKNNEEEARRQKKITDDQLAYKIQAAKQATEAEKRAVRELEAAQIKAYQDAEAARIRTIKAGAAEMRRLMKEDAAARLREERKVLAGSGPISSGSLRGIGASFVGNVAANAVSQITGYAKEGAAAWLDYSSKLEQARIGMTAMTGSAQKAEEHIKELQDFAQRTPFEFGDLVTASQKLQGVGVQAKNVIPLLTDVGNALAAAGRIDELPFAVKALGDIQAKGKLAGQEIIQLANAGIPAIQALTGYLHKTSAEVLKMSENGEISADIMFKALHKMSSERFGDAMVKQSRTFQGALSNIKDALFITSEQAFRPFYAKISKLAVDLANEVGSKKGDFEAVGTAIGTAIARGAGVVFVEFAKNIPALIGMGVKAHGEFLASIGVDAANSVLTTLGLPAFIPPKANTGGTAGPFMGPRSIPGLPTPYIDYTRPGDRASTANTNQKAIDKAQRMIADLELLKATATGQELATINKRIAVQRQILENLLQGVSPEAARSAAGGAGGGSGSISGVLSAMRSGTMGQESSGNSRARNRRTDASGLFQVMPGNIGPWTKQVFGRAMSQNDFLSSPRAQEAVFNYVMGQYLEKAMQLSGGNEDVAIRMAAAAWYGGEGAMKNYDANFGGKKGEPTFRQYTQSVLGRTRAAQRAGGVTVDDIQQDVTRAMADRSDAATKQAREQIMMTSLELYKRAGLVPTKEVIDTLTDWMTEAAKKAGVAQPAAGVVSNYLDSLKQVYYSKLPPLETTPATISDTPLQNRPLEENPYQQKILDQYNQLGEAIFNVNKQTRENILLRDIQLGQYPGITAEQQEELLRLAREADTAEAAKDAWDKYQDAAKNAFEETRRNWEDLLTDLAHGDFKSIWRRMKEQMLEAFIKPAADALARLFSGQGGAPGGQAGGGFNLGSIFGGLLGGGRAAAPSGGGGGLNLGSIFGGSAGGGIFNFGGSGGGASAGSSPLGGFTLPGLGGGGAHEAANAIGGLGSAGGGLGSLAAAGYPALLMTAIQKGLTTKNPGVGFAWLGGLGFFSALIRRSTDKTIKRLKQAAISEFGITVKDKSVLKQLQTIGEGYFGKGNVANYAVQTVHTEEGMNVLRAYAESTGQNSLKLDRLNYGDENWSGNQFRGRFAGYASASVPGITFSASAPRPSTFTPSGGGGDNGGGGSFVSMGRAAGGGAEFSTRAAAVVFGQLEETVNKLATRLDAITPGQVIRMGAADASRELLGAVQSEFAADGRATEQQQRAQGEYR